MVFAKDMPEPSSAMFGRRVCPRQMQKIKALLEMHFPSELTETITATSSSSSSSASSSSSSSSSSLRSSASSISSRSSSLFSSPSVETFFTFANTSTSSSSIASKTPSILSLSSANTSLTSSSSSCKNDHAGLWAVQTPETHIYSAKFPYEYLWGRSYSNSNSWFDGRKVRSMLRNLKQGKSTFCRPIKKEVIYHPHYLKDGKNFLYVKWDDRAEMGFARCATMQIARQQREEAEEAELAKAHKQDMRQFRRELRQPWSPKGYEADDDDDFDVDADDEDDEDAREDDELDLVEYKRARYMQDDEDDAYEGDDEA